MLYIHIICIINNKSIFSFSKRVKQCIASDVKMSDKSSKTSRVLDSALRQFRKLGNDLEKYPKQWVRITTI